MKLDPPKSMLRPHARALLEIQSMLADDKSMRSSSFFLSQIDDDDHLWLPSYPYIESLFEAIKPF